MKYIIVLTTLLFIGCNNSNTNKANTDEYAAIDSIIGKSQQNLADAIGANQKSDSLVTGKIDQTVKKITSLETQVKQLKAENNALKNQINSINDDGKPFIIRTISDDQDY